MTPEPQPAPRKRGLDLVFVVDCSGSMSGERIGALNWAVKTVLPTLRARAEEAGDVALRIRVLRFATGAAFTSAAPEPIEGFSWTNLLAEGESDLGAALGLLASALAAEPAGPDDLPASIVLVSDGYASDDAQAGLAALLATARGQAATRIPIAIGQDADMALLRRFSSDAASAPLRSHDVDMLVGRMRWVAAGPARVDAAIADKPAAHAEDGDIW